MSRSARGTARTSEWEDGFATSATGHLPTFRHYARRLPALLIVAGIVVDVASPPEYTVAALFAASPLVAAPLSSARVTLTAGLVALCTLAVLVFLYDDQPTGESVIQLAAMGAVALLALGINRLARRRSELLASARGIAEAAQLAVLPAPPERIAGLDVAARYEAAHTDARIGGDLYAVQRTPFGVRVIVGDVRGKGLGAVATVAVVLGAFREAAEEEASVEGVVSRLERTLQREAARRPGTDATEGFITAVVVEVPSGAPDRIRVVNRGHPAPLLLLGGSARFLDPVVFALPLGMRDLGSWPDRADIVPFPYDAQLLLYTDGLSEARDAEGNFYEPQRRLADRTFGGPDELVDTLLDDVSAHTGGGAADDLALLALQRRRAE